MVGNGKGSQPVIFVDDLVDMVLTVATHPAAVGEVFNCAIDPSPTVKEYLHAYGRLVGNESWFGIPTALIATVGAIIVPFQKKETYGRHLPRNMRMIDRTINYKMGKARKLLGWSPKHDVAAGVAATVPWLREQGILPGATPGRTRMASRFLGAGSVPRYRSASERVRLIVHPQRPWHSQTLPTSRRIPEPAMGRQPPVRAGQAQAHYRKHPLPVASHFTVSPTRCAGGPGRRASTRPSGVCRVSSVCGPRKRTASTVPAAPVPRRTHSGRTATRCPCRISTDTAPVSRAAHSSRGSS
jgi:hypothetical protein